MNLDIIPILPIEMQKIKIQGPKCPKLCTFLGKFLNFGNTGGVKYLTNIMSALLGLTCTRNKTAEWVWAKAGVHILKKNAGLIWLYKTAFQECLGLLINACKWAQLFDRRNWQYNKVSSWLICAGRSWCGWSNVLQEYPSLIRNEISALLSQVSLAIKEFQGDWGLGARSGEQELRFRICSLFRMHNLADKLSVLPQIMLAM